MKTIKDINAYYDIVIKPWLNNTNKLGYMDSITLDDESIQVLIDTTLSDSRRAHLFGATHDGYRCLMINNYLISIQILSMSLPGNGVKYSIKDLAFDRIYFNKYNDINKMYEEIKYYSNLKDSFSIWALARADCPLEILKQNYTILNKKGNYENN